MKEKEGERERPWCKAVRHSLGEVANTSTSHHYDIHEYYRLHFISSMITKRKIFLALADLETWPWVVVGKLLV
jgi:hypothetical protein